MFFHGTHSELSDSIEAIGAGFAVFEYDARNDLFILVSCNQLYEETTGRPMADMLNHALSHFFPRYVSTPLLDIFYESKSKQAAVETEILVDYKGEERIWRSIISPISQTEEGVMRVIQTCVEITEKKKLERELTSSMNRFEAVVQSAYDGIITIDEEHNIKLINRAALEIFGYTDEEVVGQPLTNLLPLKYRKDHKSYVNGFKKSVVNSRPMQTRASVRALRKGGVEFPIEVTISKIRVGEEFEMTAVIRDISEKNHLMEELLVSATQDSLTQLLNRRHFSELMSKEIARFERFAHGFSLLMFDLDHFKSINDNFGHNTGDEALKRFAEILIARSRETDTLCRWGGEEFLVLLPETSVQQASVFAEDVRKHVEALTLDYRGSDVKFTVSIGIVFVEGEKISVESMVSAVDEMLYQAKRNGRNRVEIKAQ